MSDSILDAVVTEYLKAIEAGETPDTQEWIARHPELADELRAFVEQHAKLQGLVARLAKDETIAPDAAARDVPTLRYVGDYELLGEIARGGMGVVFRARQRTLGREVAVKMMLAGTLAGDVDLARFRTEAEAAAGLDHPNVLPLYEVGEHEGLPYFSMKLVEGGSLAQAMPQMRDDPRRAAHLMSLVARAVHHAHQRGVLHRDLKPANVLLDADGTPFVGDFGLARRGVDRGQTQTGQVLGTPSYMAPEQARAEKTLSVAVDVYALGAILYECLTGQPPFRAEGVLDTLMQVIEKEPAHPRSLTSTADADLSVIALKCLSKEPAKRYASASELADDLERWQRGEPILARPVGRGERLLKWVRRRPAVAGLTIACILTVLIGTATSTLSAFVARKHERIALVERAQARHSEQEARRRLARSHVLEGNRLLDAGDDFGALVWFAEALKLDEGDAEREKLHRLRLGTMMRHAPRLKQIARVPEGESHLYGTAERYVSSVKEVLSIRETKTGRLVGTLRSTQPNLFAQISRDGKTLLTYGCDLDAAEVVPSAVRYYPKGTTLRLWNLADAKPLSPEVLVVPGPPMVRLAADGKRVLAWLDDGRVALLDLAAEKETFGEARFQDVGTMRSTPDGRRLLVAECPREVDRDRDATFHVLDGNTLASVGKSFSAKQHPERLIDARLSPDGKTALVTQFDEACSFDVASGAIVRKERLVGLRDVAVHDKANVFALFGDQGTQVFDLSRDASTQWSKPSNRLARYGWFSPDAAALLVAEGVGSDELRLYERRTGRVLSPGLRGVGQFSDPWFADEDSFVVADSADLLWTWQLAASNEPLAGPFAAERLVFSDDRSRYFLGDEHGWQAHDGRTGKTIGPRLEADGHVWPNADGSLALFRRDDALQVLDVKSGKSRPMPGEAKVDGRWVSNERLELIDWAGKRRWVLGAESLRPTGREGADRTTFLDRRLIRWEGDRGREIVLDPPPPEPRDSSTRMGEASLFCVTRDALHVWDAATGKQRYVRKLSGYGVETLVGPNDRVAMCRTNARGQNELHLLDGTTGEPTAPPAALPQRIAGMAFSPDGARLVVCSRLSSGEIEFDVQVRDATTGTQLTPRLPNGTTYGLEQPPFSADGRLLLANGRLYDATTGDPLSQALAFPVGTGGFRADGSGVVMRVGEAKAYRMVYAPLVYAEGTAEELLARAELLACRKVNAAGALADLTPDEVLARLK